MVLLQTLGRSFVLIIVASNILQGYAYSEAEEATGMVNDAPDTPGKGDVYNVKNRKGGRRVIPGGCTRLPDAPVNGRIACSAKRGVASCIASCASDYKFPNGMHQLTVTCVEKEWQIQGTEWSVIPHCEPICMPECQNNGICIAPHQCNCPEHFTGPQCQFEDKPCLNHPPPALNSYRKCNSKSCTVMCMKNFTFPDGSSVANLICKNGSWKPARGDWVSIPDCEPVCNPPCQNGGNCLPMNLCQCPQNYRGPQCQYSADACDAKNLHFNGGYYCTSTDDKYSCTLDCPAESKFEFSPAVAYICTYDTGTFQPQPIPQCQVNDNAKLVSHSTTYNTYVRESNHSWTTQDTFSGTTKSSPGFQDIRGDTTSNTMIVETSRPPKPKTCFTWGGVHYKTFDDRIYSFDSDCPHVLLREARDDIFTILTLNAPGCKTTDGRCSKIVKLFIPDKKEYTLASDETGIPTFSSGKRLLPIPAYLPGLRVDKSARFILVSLDSLGVKLKWDGSLLLQIEASESMWNKTAGLCGTMNDNPNDDFLTNSGTYTKSISTLADSWRVNNLGETCDEHPNTQHACEVNNEFGQDAFKFCVKLLSNRKFKSCAHTIDFHELTEACLWDYCACKNGDGRKCACNTMDVYMRQCVHKGIVAATAWRNNDTCPISCENGRVYMSCGPKVESSCFSALETKGESPECEEGCFCPASTVEHEGSCVMPQECPCKLRGKLFEPGTSVPKGCNTCTCTAGKWICTQVQCDARCSVLGDPHYTTFDGKHYNFMGKCKYYLMKGDNYTIATENVQCSGAISESMGFAPADSPSCTKAVTVHFKDTSIKLKQNRQITVNGDEVTKLPMLLEGARVRLASSIFLVVNLPNDLEIWWDGMTRVYINAPAKFHGRTKGLCGTFSGNQKDDFATPDGDVETGAIAFANKWKVNKDCVDSKNEPKDPCELNPQKRATAEEYCSKIHSDIFSQCHEYVDRWEFHEDCMYDMCACDTDVKSCLCPILAAYAESCAILGVKLSWRSNIDECKVHCGGGQTYQICGNSCTRSCEDISFYQDCRQECVEGCNCPESQTLDKNGECIPIAECPCVYAGHEYKANHREVRPGNKGQEFCICTGGVWSCRLATPEEIRDYPPVTGLLSTCVASKHLEVTDCEPAERRTCSNMHVPEERSPAVCTSGCVCKAGYVLDAPDGVCIPEKDCPCHHGGKSYKEGSVIQAECNTCTCKDTKWECTDRICAGVCSIWGDSHYKTFDGKMYDFQGICDYVLVKSKLSKEESFDISIQNVPCGTNGVACSKSITLVVGSGDQREELVLTRGKKLPEGPFKRMTIRTTEFFVFVDVPDLRLVLQWDRGTRVYVRLNPEWKGRTMGLCGDYNDNAEDDFKTPSGGISEASVNLFGDSWKKDTFCPEPQDIPDACEQYPHRKLWSLQRCNVLKSSVFSPCHSEVEVEPYLRNCVFDACSCDSGGDCECLCTALAAYAHECNAKGVPIKWRTQELCPCQCDEEFGTYSPCVSTCPRETCDNLMTVKDGSHLCAEDTCVEGCRYKGCPVGQVYWNDTYAECTSKSMCKTPFCTEIDGVTYYEGDRVRGDDCQSCFCSRGKVTCKGEPCTTGKPVTVSQIEPQKCIDGWSKWINRDKAMRKKTVEVEPLPDLTDLENPDGLAICDKEHMVDIRCRSAKRHLSPKQSGLDVECSLERGLYCRSSPGLPCIDFEISVLCRCAETSVAPEPHEYRGATTEPGVERPTENEECDPAQPNSPHPTDCRLFYQCVPTATGRELVEKSCGPGTLYDVKLQVCNLPADVRRTRPECSGEQTTPSEAEWSETNTGINNEKTMTTSVKKVVSTEKCPEGETWSECAVRCSKACHYYRRVLTTQGHCSEGEDCVADCVSDERPTCSPHRYRRDSVTCVDANECPCESHDGNLVAPGAVRKESDCETCQCVNNYYTCDNTLCGRASTTHHEEYPGTTGTSRLVTEQPLLTTPSEYEWRATSPTEHEYTVLLRSTVSPPADCDSANYVPLVRSLPEKATIYASSNKIPALRSENLFVRAPGASSPNVDSWQPKVSRANEWLAVEFDKPEPVYGVILQGAVTEDKYVTSYKLLFSEDGQTFSHVLDHEKQPRVFRGPVDETQSVEQRLDQPIEAKVIRIEPLTWHNGIAVRADVLGCQEHLTSVSTELPTVKTTVSEKVVKPVCDDPMGLDNQLMAIEQVSVSSSPQLIRHLPLSSDGVWRSALDNPHQYVEFDFLEPRNLTGVTTKGGEGAWTTAYEIFYSNDRRQWNPVIDEDGNEREFLGNFDTHSRKTNLFEKPLHARYLKIQPTKWHEHVALKVEPLGCYSAYPPASFETPSPSTPSSFERRCNVCDGIESTSNDEGCRCKDPYWWDGESCVPKQECPCVVGHVPYAVGSVYETEDCRECVCAMGGTAACMPKKCEPCGEPGLRSVVSELCTCLCKPCPTGTVHCPTSDVCINDTAWCNGVQDCPDDEVNCEERNVALTTFKSEATPRPHRIEPPSCEEPSCPPDYRVVYKPTYQSTYSVSMYAKRNVKSSVKGHWRTKGHRKPPFDHHPWKHTDRQSATEDVRCPEFTCAPTTFPPIRPGGTKPDMCPQASCPPDYEVVYEKMSMYKLYKCPKYACRPQTPEVAFCNVTGRSFSTFDHLEYKYDVCNHLLARDMYNNKWYITLEKQCDSPGRPCTRVLVVTLDDRVIVLYPDLHVDIDEHSLTAGQVARLGNRFPDFKLSRTGDSIVLLSRHYGFWVARDSATNVKIGVVSKLAGKVDGLCGYYDGDIANDRQTPEGKQARSTVQFGDSWAMEGTPACEPQVCPRDVQERAWAICNSVKSPALVDTCHAVVDIDKFVSRCVENSCACLRGDSASYEDCRCRLLTSFVSECEAAVPGADLSDWRRIHDCPASCPPPFVHRDCFRNKCELTCDNLRELEPCPTMRGVCFPGCFCPDGLVRRDDECVPPVRCRDCVCDGLGNSKFIGFDRRDLSFAGNCTYVLSRNVADRAAKGQTHGAHAYQVLVSNGECGAGMCTKAVTLLYEKHAVQIKQRAKQSKELRVSIDDSRVAEFPLNRTWITLDRTSAGDVSLVLPAIQLELAAFRQNFAFTLKLPSHIFDDATEGLCGSCNADAGFKKRDGQITDNAEEFGKSWLADDLPTELGLSDRTCTSERAVRCEPPPTDQDICKKLLNLAEFQQCHGIVDPKPYLDCCHDELCTGGNYCDSMEMYARKCSEVGLCPAWRTDDICPYDCPKGLVYQPCAPGCKETCDTPADGKCSSDPVEGCFCPKDHVFHNDTCVPRKNCHVCDKDGHVEGDVWRPDKCTECKCHDGAVSCEKTECPLLDTICEENMTPVLVNDTKKRCCAKYLCVSKPTAPVACVEPQEPECGFGQVTKTITGDDGCYKIICQCLPENECPDVAELTNEVEKLEPGFVQVMNTSGCCPRPAKMCDPKTCPPAPDCPKYYNTNMIAHEDSCCPNYECVPPKDICLYTSDDDRSGQHVIARKIGEEWKDGKCKTCVCENSHNGPKPNCMIMDCPSVHEHPDANDYVLKEILLDDKCCPVFERSACKNGDIVYNVGESWKPDVKDACVTMECDQHSGSIQKQVKVQECNIVCDSGYKYQHSNDTAVDCCGKCVQTACIVEDTLKNVGEEWQSDDHCVTYTCDSTNGGVYVQASTETCPELDPQLESEFEIETRKVPGKCCPEIVKTACRSDGKSYKPGKKWKSLADSCVTETCTTGPNITKHKEVQVCSKQCAQGWSYQEPEDGECCGECKQTSCVYEGILYAPDMTWSSDDNCTTYTCLKVSEQLTVSVSPAACPDITECPEEAIYHDECCKQCKLSVVNQLAKEQNECKSSIMDAKSTVGMLVVNHPLYGICKNLHPIEGIKQCKGACESSTYFDTKKWKQANNCQCCQAEGYIGIIVDLTCEDGRRLKKQLASPTACSCQICASETKNEDRKTKTKG